MVRGWSYAGLATLFLSGFRPPHSRAGLMNGVASRLLVRGLPLASDVLTTAWRWRLRRWRLSPWHHSRAKPRRARKQAISYTVPRPRRCFGILLASTSPSCQRWLSPALHLRGCGRCGLCSALLCSPVPPEFADFLPPYG